MTSALTWPRLRIRSLAFFSGSESFMTIHTPDLLPPGALGWWLSPPCAMSQETPTTYSILLFSPSVVDVLLVH